MCCQFAGASNPASINAGSNPKTFLRHTQLKFSFHDELESWYELSDILNYLHHGLRVGRINYALSDITLAASLGSES